jgi:hypothetical protein
VGATATGGLLFRIYTRPAGVRAAEPDGLHPIDVQYGENRSARLTSGDQGIVELLSRVSGSGGDRWPRDWRLVP